jgi:hypothetical protein
VSEVVVARPAAASIWLGSTLTAGGEEDKGGLAVFGDGGNRATS